MVSGTEIRVNKCAQERVCVCVSVHACRNLQFTLLAALGQEEKNRKKDEKVRKAHMRTRQWDRSVSARDICRFSISHAALAAD